MAGYTDLNEHAANAILSLYGKGKVDTLVSMTHGISNSNYKITMQDGEELLLKIANDKTREEMQSEQEVLLWLHTHGYQYSLCPLTTLTDSHVYQWQEFYGVLFPFVYGETPDVNQKTCSEIAKALAKLHKTKPDNKIRQYSTVGQDYIHIKDYLESSNVDAEFNKVATLLFENLNWQDFDGDLLPTGFIHGDLYYDNTLFEDDAVKYVLDFEQAGVNAPLLFDIGISISGTCIDNHGVIQQNLIDSYVQGYEEVRPLNSIERKNINQAIILGLLSIALWRIIRFNHKQITQDKEESYKELLNRAIVFHKGL